MGMKVKDRGIITIAQGKKRYIDMAINLAISVKLNCPDISLAVITDSTDEELKKYFDFIIPIKSEYGIGLTQKLHIYEYSIFQETLFIDADCMLVRPVYFLFDQFSSHKMSCIGYKRTENKLFGLTAQELMKRFGTSYIIGHNGGVYYFKKCPAAEIVFDKAISLLNEYDAIGFERLRGNINEEPLLAVAMSMQGIIPVDDKGEGMRTPVGQKGVFRIDALKGYCEFYKFNERVAPAIMHFGGAYPEAFHYRREALKINMVYRWHLPRKLVSGLVNTFYNPVYISYVFIYRILKSVLKGQKLKLSPLMPMFRFE